MGCCSTKDSVATKDGERPADGRGRDARSTDWRPPSAGAGSRSSPSPTHSDPESAGAMLPPILQALARATAPQQGGEGDDMATTNPEIAAMLTQVTELEELRRMLSSEPGNEDAIRDIDQHLRTLSMLSLLALMAIQAAKEPKNNTDETINRDAFEFVKKPVGSPAGRKTPSMPPPAAAGLGSGSNLDAQSSGNEEEEESSGPDCTVCSFPLSEEVPEELGTIPEKLLGSFGTDNNATIMCCRCNNYFHAACLAKWMEGHDACPLCRASFVKEEQSPKKQRAGGAVEEIASSDDEEEYPVPPSDGQIRR